MPLRVYRRPVALLALLVLGALGAGMSAGCQRTTVRDPSVTTTVPVSLTVDELTRRADRICLAARARSDEIGNATDPALVPSALDSGSRLVAVDAATAMIDIDRAEYSGLRALRVPKELAATFDAFLETKRARLIAADDAITALAAGDDTAYAAARAAEADATARTGVQGVALGFVECSRS